MAALHRQIFAYSKGHVAYHWTTYLRDGDRRALRELAFNVPRGRARRLRRWLRGKRDFPLSLILVEAAGNLMGAWGLWLARRRVAREGPSVPGELPSETHLQMPGQREVGARVRMPVPTASRG